MKTLKLTVNKQWFDLIQKGIKTEEYRQIKRYWQTRLQINGYHRFEFKKFDLVEFTNGYNKNSPQVTLECEGIEIGTPKMELGGYLMVDDTGQMDECYIIKLGREVGRQNC